jgi:hypothetical protein
MVNTHSLPESPINANRRQMNGSFFEQVVFDWQSTLQIDGSSDTDILACRKWGAEFQLTPGSLLRAVVNRRAEISFK